jgi:hypothetical protein
MSVWGVSVWGVSVWGVSVWGVSVWGLSVWGLSVWSLSVWGRGRSAPAAAQSQRLYEAFVAVSRNCSWYSLK